MRAGTLVDRSNRTPLATRVCWTAMRTTRRPGEVVSGERSGTSYAGGHREIGRSSDHPATPAMELMGRRTHVGGWTRSVDLTLRAHPATMRLTASDMIEALVIHCSPLAGQPAYLSDD